MTKIDIVGIRSKSTCAKPTFLFSVECEDKTLLENTMDIVKQTLYNRGFDINHIKKYHDRS